MHPLHIEAWEESKNKISKKGLINGALNTVKIAVSILNKIARVTSFL